MPSSSETATMEDTWLVKTGTGQRALTLEELDEAYQRGIIGASTLVFTPGMDGWQTLGVVAGLDAPQSAEQLATAPTQRGRRAPRPLDSGSVPVMTAPVSSSTRSELPAAEEVYTHTRVRAHAVPYFMRRVAGAVADRISAIQIRRRITAPALAAVVAGVLVYCVYQSGGASPTKGRLVRAHAVHPDGEVGRAATPSPTLTPATVVAAPPSVPPVQPRPAAALAVTGADPAASSALAPLRSAEPSRAPSRAEARERRTRSKPNARRGQRGIHKRRPPRR